MAAKTKYLEQNCAFESLPPAIQQAFGNSPREYDKAIVDYALSHQVRWRKSAVRNIIREELKYYAKMLEYSMNNLMLYPYHLADIMVLKLKMTPFLYYHTILCDMLAADKNYDALPNFTATDCLALLGIGRNEYMDTLNLCKGGKTMFRKRTPPKQLLPKHPMLPATVSYWWLVRVGRVTEADMKNATPAQKELIDSLLDRQQPSQAGRIDLGMLGELFQAGFLYLDVPIEDDDMIKIPPLEGIVMNRVLGDYLEKLLYKIFVCIDEHTTVAELSSVLQIPLQRTKDAISMYCRLGFAFKKNLDIAAAQHVCHSSWDQELSAAAAAEEAHVLHPAYAPDGKRLALLFDVSLTACLMMGVLSSGVKRHAVTMYEVGKLAHEGVDILLHDLDETRALAASSKSPTQAYTDQAVHLSLLLRFLRESSALKNTASRSVAARPVRDSSRSLSSAGESISSLTSDSSLPLAVDLVRCESLAGLDPATRKRILQRNYHTLLALAPLGDDVQPPMSVHPPLLGPPIPEFNSLWARLWLASLQDKGDAVLFARGTRVTQLPECLKDYETVLFSAWGREQSLQPSQDLLLTLNDALSTAPVLVQGLGMLRQHMVLLKVPLLLAEASEVAAVFPETTLTAADDARVQLWHRNMAMLHTLPAVAAVVKAVNASFVGMGYMSVYIALDVMPACMQGDEPDTSSLDLSLLASSIKHVCVHELHFGLPLDDVLLLSTLACHLKERMPQNDVFAADQRKLSLKMLSFMIENHASKVDCAQALRSCEDNSEHTYHVPWPTKSIACSNTVLSVV